MPKSYYLINEVNQTKSNKHDYLFFDEYLGNLSNDFTSKEKNFFFSFKDLENLNLQKKKAVKKVNKYIIQIKDHLNHIHSTNFSLKYWGFLIEHFLLLIVTKILVEKELLDQIKKKNKNIHIPKVNFNKNKTYLTTHDYVASRVQDNSQAYVRYLISRELGFKSYTCYKKKNYTKFRENTKPSLIENFIRKFFQNYVKIIKPKLILDSYLTKKDKMKIFLLSYGKILCLPKKYLFNFFCKKVKKKELRKKIFVIENDLCDKIFNIVIKDFLPSSFIENFKDINIFLERFENLDFLGTGTLHIYNDDFKILAAKIMEKKGKLIILPHGGFLGLLEFDYDDYVERKYASKLLRWTDKKPLKQNQLNQLKKYPINRIVENDEILFYPTTMMLKANYKIPLLRKYHPLCNFYYNFYEFLDEDLKKKVKIKPFPEDVSKKFEQNWISKYNLDPFIESKKNLFRKFKIVVINDFSTPLCELIYTDTPFIIIDPEKKNLKKEILFQVKKLKSINVYFDNIKAASAFLNKNYYQIDVWWKKILKSKYYNTFKKNIIPDKSKSQDLNTLIKSMTE